MSSSQDKLIRQFSKLKNKYLDLERTNEMLVEKILHLSNSIKFKEEQKSKLIQLCSEKISKKNDFIESLQGENRHLQEIVAAQNEQILEQERTIEKLKNTTDIQTAVIRHPCFGNVKTKKEPKKKPIQVRYPNLNITINGRRKVTLNKSPKLIIGNRQRRKLYISDDETVDLSNSTCNSVEPSQASLA